MMYSCLNVGNLTWVFCSHSFQFSFFNLFLTCSLSRVQYLSFSIEKKISTPSIGFILFSPSPPPHALSLSLPRLLAGPPHTCKNPRWLLSKVHQSREESGGPLHSCQPVPPSSKKPPMCHSQAKQASERTSNKIVFWQLLSLTLIRQTARWWKCQFKRSPVNTWFFWQLKIK